MRPTFTIAGLHRARVLAVLCAVSARVDAEPSTSPADSPNTNAAVEAPSNDPANPANPPVPPSAVPGAAEPSVIVPPQALGPFVAAYPAGAQGDGSVILELLITAEGGVSQAHAVSGDPPFTQAAELAALSWRFKPAQRNGQDVAARIRAQVDFHLESVPADDPALSVEPGEAQAGSAAPVQSAAATPLYSVTVGGQRSIDVKKLGKAEVRQLPGAFGDPYRAIEVLPGVTPIASGLPYFFVRGAPPGNVGYFFDGVSVPLLYHVAAGPGVIHPAFIRSVDLYAGGYPARYGRYVGGIVAGEAEDPSGVARGEANIRLVDAGAFVEVPFANQRGNAMVAGRYSYTGAVVSLLAPEVTVGYWDYQAKVRYQLSGKDSVSVFGFGSHDFLSAENDNGVKEQILDLTFHRLTADYQRQLTPQSSLRLTALTGLDRTGVGGDPDDADQRDQKLETRTLGARALYTTALSPGARLEVGADVYASDIDIALDFPNNDDFDEVPVPALSASITYPEPGFPQLVLDPFDRARTERIRTAARGRFAGRNELLGGTWVQATLEAGAFSVVPGLRLDWYNTGTSRKVTLEPRLGLRVAVSPAVTLFQSIGVAHQTPSFAIPLPGLSGTPSEALQRAAQSSSGVELKLPWKLWGSATLFQNATFNSTDQFGAANLRNSNPNLSAFAERTLNHSYGLELYLKRSLTERLGGLLSYTLSRSTRSVQNISGPSSFDRRHVLNLALAYEFRNRVRLGSRLVAYSGVPAQVAYAAVAKDPPRTPAYYRLDWRLEKRWPIGEGGAYWALVAEVLNTTLNLESLRSSCYAYGCNDNPIGPVTVPSIGLEASF
jgi:TonB family protein